MDDERPEHVVIKWNQLSLFLVIFTICALIFGSLVLMVQLVRRGYSEGPDFIPTIFITVVVTMVVQWIWAPINCALTIGKSGLKLGTAGYGQRVVEWDEIVDVSSSLRGVKISCENKVEWMLNPSLAVSRAELVKAVDRFAPLDSPLRRLFKS